MKKSAQVICPYLGGSSGTRGTVSVRSAGHLGHAPGRHPSLEELDRRLRELGLDPSLLEERFIRAGGKGGQHVNKTSTAVQLRHPAIDLEVRAEGERSQLQNRLEARERLIRHVIETRLAAEEAARAEREQHRRRTRRPPPGARRKTLEQKRRRGGVKRSRGRVAAEE